jgi:hypothetical protein
MDIHKAIEFLKAQKFYGSLELNFQAGVLLTVEKQETFKFADAPTANQPMRSTREGVSNGKSAS